MISESFKKNCILLLSWETSADCVLLLFFFFLIVFFHAMNTLNPLSDQVGIETLCGFASLVKGLA